MRPANIFHIGYQRTGSTYLQQTVFYAYPDYMLHRGTGEFFIEDELYAQGAEFYRGMRAGETTVPALIESHNGLCGDALVDRPYMAERIHALFPDAKIIFGVRSQHSIIPSFYFLYVKGGGTLDYASYVRLVIENGKFAFDRMIGHYQGLFGSDYVLVLPFEYLQQDYKDYVRRFLDFVEVPQSEGIRVANSPMKERQPDSTILSMRHTNRLISTLRLDSVMRLLPNRTARRLRSHYNGLMSAGSRRLIPRTSGSSGLNAAAMAPVIEGAFADSNRALAAMIKSSLAGLGYPGLDEPVAKAVAAGD
jgi:hypothetical protein